MESDFDAVGYIYDLPLPKLYEILEENSLQIKQKEILLSRLKTVKQYVKSVIDGKEDEVFRDLKVADCLNVQPDISKLSEVQITIINDFWSNPNQTANELAKNHNVTPFVVDAIINKALKGRKRS